MTNEQVIGRAVRRLLREYRRLGSWRAVARARGVNHGHCVVLVNHGRVPCSVRLRELLGLPRVLPSERKPRVKTPIPLLGSEGWESRFFKKVKK